MRLARGVLVLESEMTLTGVHGREITDFMVDCDDDRYQAWWPGTHRAFHVVERAPAGDHVGDLVWMDERVGPRHLRMTAEVVEVVPGERVAWQLRPHRLRLPVRVTLTLCEHGRGLRLRHTTTAGWAGWRRVLDPVWRLYFTPEFAIAMDMHARTEFSRLRDLLHAGGTERPA